MLTLSVYISVLILSFYTLVYYDNSGVKPDLHLPTLCLATPFSSIVRARKPYSMNHIHIDKKR